MSQRIIFAALALTLLSAPAALAVPHVDTALTAATPLPDPDLVVVREQFYGAEGVDLTAYGIDDGPHTYVQSLYFRLFADNSGSTIDSYSALVELPPSVSILGIITSSAMLGGSNDDGILTESDLTFGIGTDPDRYSENARGFETAGGLSSEYLGIIDDHTFAFALHVGGGVDDFRVIIDYGDEFTDGLSFDLRGLDVVPPEGAVLQPGVQVGDTLSTTVPGAGDWGETGSLLGIPLTSTADPTPAPILSFDPDGSLYMVRDQTGPTYVDTYDTALNVPFPTQFTLTPTIPNPRGLTDHEDGNVYCSGRDGTLGIIDPVTRIVTQTSIDNLTGNVADNTNLPGHAGLFLVRDTSGDSEVDVLDLTTLAYVQSTAISGVATPVAIVDGSDGFLYLVNQNGRIGWMSASGDSTFSFDMDPPGGSYRGATSMPGSDLLYLLRNTSEQTQMDVFDVTTKQATFGFASLDIPLSPGDITDGPGGLLYVVGDGQGGAAGYTVVDPDTGAVLFSHEIMDFFGTYKAITALTPQASAVGPGLPDAAPQVRHFAAPNPFNPSTTIRYEVKRAGESTVVILDVRGRVVRELHQGRLPSGWARHEWNGLDNAGRTAPSGTYLYLIRTSEGTAAGKLMLVK